MEQSNSIIQNLRRIQDRYGYLHKEALRELADLLSTPLHRIHEVASCFPSFRLPAQNGAENLPPRLTVKVCRDLTCHLRGAAHLVAELRAFGESTGYQQDEFAVEEVSCLGRCDRAPVVRLNEGNFVQQTAAELKSIISRTFEEQAIPKSDLDADQQQHMPRWEIDVYAHDADLPPYAAVRQFVESFPAPTDNLGRNPGAVSLDDIPLLQHLKAAGLLGMGGAGTPAFKKWSDVFNADGGFGDDYAKYVVCNADESEPGTFKDRELLLRTPHLVIEGMILAGLLINATRGFVYLRHEFQEQIEAVEHAIREAERLRVCGERILDTEWSFPIEIFVSPGGYICGEQTALLEAMEDRRAEPRNRPPEISTNGLFDKPTLLNNVETLAWVPSISLRGGESYRDQTKSLRKGRRFFSISGDVNQPGVYEVPVGISLGTLIDQYAGGMLGDKSLKACAPSGPSGGFLPAILPIDRCLVDRLRKHIVRTREAAAEIRQRVDDDTQANLTRALNVDAEMLEIDAQSLERFVDECLPRGTEQLDIRSLPLDLIIVRNHMNLMLGAGIVICAAGTDIVGQAVNATEFFRNETCGKCIPCRLGSEQLVQIGRAIQNGSCDMAWIDRTRDEREALVQTMCDTSICGLGYAASVPISTLLEYFRADVEQTLSQTVD